MIGMAPCFTECVRRKSAAFSFADFHRSHGYPIDHNLLLGSGVFRLFDNLLNTIFHYKKILFYSKMMFAFSRY